MEFRLIVVRLAPKGNFTRAHSIVRLPHKICNTNCGARRTLVIVVVVVVTF